jgi:hypothetical protein
VSPPRWLRCSFATFLRNGGRLSRKFRISLKNLFSENRRKIFQFFPLVASFLCRRERLHHMATTTTTTPKAATASKVALPIKGSTTLAAIAEAMGARPDGHAYAFDLSIEIVGESIQAKSASVTSNADKENALASLTPAERKAVEKFNTLCKASATARVEGQTITKTTWQGIAKG